MLLDWAAAAPRPPLYNNHPWLLPVSSGHAAPPSRAALSRARSQVRVATTLSSNFHNIQYLLLVESYVSYSFYNQARHLLLIINRHFNMVSPPEIMISVLRPEDSQREAATMRSFKDVEI